MKFIPLSSFDHLGGWTLDSQFIDQMGSAYLLAHGRGVPVADATGTLRVEKVEKLRVWVRTRDWCGGAGRFVVKIGDWTSKELGVGASEWHWEDCGVVELPKGEVEIRLHDLTGFEGRCAGVALTEVNFTADDFVIRRISNDSVCLRPAEYRGRQRLSCQGCTCDCGKWGCPCLCVRKLPFCG